MKRNYLVISLLILVALVAGSYLLFRKKNPNGSQSRTKIVYGISPYQDTALPVVAQEKGWYLDDGLDVQIKLLQWGDVMSSLASGSVDVAIQNFNSFQEQYHNIVPRGGDVVFYYPLYVFKGAAIMIKPSGGMKTLEETLNTFPTREEAIVETVKQLKGKRILTTKGTEMEQIVLAALKKADLKEGVDVKIIHAQPDDALRAFLHGDADAYSGGVTERTEAKKNGAAEMILSDDLTPPVIDGLVTSKKFADQHPAELQKLIRNWFRTIQFMESDLDNHSKIVIDYLARNGSTRYSVEEYKGTWFNTEIYPKNSEELGKLLLDPASKYFWQRVWDANNAFLLEQKKIPSPVPSDVLWFGTIHKAISAGAE